MDNQYNSSGQNKIIRFWIIIAVMLFLFIAMCATSTDKNNEHKNQHPASKVIVYITQYGECYHSENCIYLYSSKIKTNLYEANSKGYRRCRVCKPDDTLLHSIPDVPSEKNTSGYSEKTPVLSVTFIILSIATYGMIQGSSSNSKKTSYYTAATRNKNEVYTQYSQEQTTDPTTATCKLLWISAYRIAKYFDCQYSDKNVGSIWATLFYISTKHIRNQNIVSKIYSHFDSCAILVAETQRQGFMSVSIVALRNSYRNQAQLLNESQIDPRTKEGLHKLWFRMLKEIDAEYNSYEAAKNAFMEYASLIIDDANRYTKTLPPAK